VKTLLAIFVTFFATSVFAQRTPEPFGFHYGSTKADVIKQLGNASVTNVSKDGTSVSFTTAPNPHPDFEKYVLFFSPTKGLLKIVAIGKDITTGDDGSELRQAFNRLRKSLDTKYGKSQGLDNCKDDGAACESRFFMMELKSKNRNLFAIWQAEGTGITLDAYALRINVGYVTLSYEFPGWSEFVDARNTKKDSVL